MTKFLVTALSAFFVLTAIAGQETRVIHVKRVAENAITVDGAVEAAWETADSATSFFQLSPYYNQRPSSGTIAKVLTTSDALYCLMVCYENSDEIQKMTGMQDEFAGDIVSIMLDTFNDKQTAYKLAVSASGVRADCRMLDDARNRDYSWDGVWFSATQMYDWGFVVEMKIPYKSIRYNKELTEWGVDFDRWLGSRKEDLYWNTYDKNEGMRISKFGRLIFDDFRPSAAGVNLEVYPVGIAKATYLRGEKYRGEPNAGIDIFYNPSEKLTFQLTGNPDFAQIEADPFSFNITRYETYYQERRPFFTEGNEVFMASGKQQNSGFYKPLELFYSRRIGKLLPDGTEIPLSVGTKAFGRLGDWQYGGFYARTAATDYTQDGGSELEPGASFVAGRVKKQVFDNSFVGVLFVGKSSIAGTEGVIDVDGAFRTSTWQLAYQFARSIQGRQGDYGSSLGFTMFGEHWMNLLRVRAIGNDFDVSEVGYVPWRGTGELTAISGPTWFYDTGALQQLQLYLGTSLYYEHADLYTDRSAIFGINMQFRDNWGYELDLTGGRSKDSGIRYTSYDASFSSWYNISPKWWGNLWCEYTRTYNFSRDYLAPYGNAGLSIGWKMLSTFELGTSYNMYIEGNPEGRIEDITYNARPYVSLTPVNNLNLRMYVDNLYVQSSDKLEHVIMGFLFSYNFLPKSWIYLALNELQDRSEQYDGTGRLLPRNMHVAARAGVMKVKYLYYF